MLIDLTLKLTKAMLYDSITTSNDALAGHAGTHFDVMDKEFPLNYTERNAIVFDVSHVRGHEIDCTDIDLSSIEKDMFICFYTGYNESVPYGAPGYFTEHPQLSYALIDALLDKGISIIGLDFAGIRRTPEHIPADQRCADRGVFVIENICNMKDVLMHGSRFTACTYPLYCTELTGLPCRVIAKLY